MVQGQQYLLKRLGFGLNTAPQVLKAIMKIILAQDAKIEYAVLPYIDDLLVNEDLVSVSVEQVTAHFTIFGLESKQLACAADRAWLQELCLQPVKG